jgi:hypothetical protein
MEVRATVAAWDPPRRFVGEAPLPGPNAPTMATEWTVEARGGGRCVVRVVHSLFADTDDWDDQLEGTESGWPGIFRVLRLYLERFRGQPAAGFQMMVPVSADVDAAWRRFLDAQPETALSLAGERVPSPDAHERLLVLAAPAAGIARLGAHAQGAGTAVIVTVYLYGEGARATIAAHEARWRAWLGDAAS